MEGDKMTEQNDRLGIGGNNPPAHEAIAAEIADVELEAKNWFDGAAIENAEQAEAVATLTRNAQGLWHKAEASRKEEAKPFDDGKKAVQARWKPIQEKADRIAKTGLALSNAWLKAQEKLREAEVARLAAEAEAAAEAARAAHAAANPTNLAEQEQAEAAIEHSKAVAAEAARAAKQSTTVKGEAGRALGLRTVKRAVLVDIWAAADHYFKTRPAEFETWVLDQAQKDVRGGAASIPGFEIHVDRVAV